MSGIHALLCAALLAFSQAQIGTVIEAGDISYADASHGPDYLAIRAPRGTMVRICGPASCQVLRSTDYGPSSRIEPNRIADLALSRWLDICGVPASRGLCKGSIEYPIDVPAAPETDVE